MKVRAYRNLTKSCWSVIEKGSGRLLFHTDELAMRDCKFVVSESGRQRVLKEQRKNVHAFVEGKFASKQCWRDAKQKAPKFPLPISYNPYKSATFKWATSEEPLVYTDIAWLDHDGRLWGLTS